MKTKKDNRPPKHERTRKRGDVREDGMVFWQYSAKVVGGECWVTPEKFVECRISHRAADTRYRRTEEGRAKKREYTARYQRTEGGRAKLREGQARYRRTEEGRAKKRELQARYRQTEKGRAKKRELQARYRQTEKGRAKNREHKARYYQTEEGRIVYAVRRAALRATKYAGQNKPSSSFKLLGTDLETFKTYIESRFVDSMSWDNYGEWHIDHIIPLASGKTPEEVWGLCHYTNLQPLWATDNIRKGAKILEDSA